MASVCLGLTLIVASGTAIAWNKSSDDEGDDEPGGGNAEECVLYMVQDTALGDSAFHTAGLVDPLAGVTLGPEATFGSCADCDVEAIGIDPSAGTLYGIAGGDGASLQVAPGDVFEVDKSNGDLSIIGSTGTGLGAEIVSASFRPTDGSLWAFQEGSGLLTVDVADGSSTAQFPVAGVLDQFKQPVGLNWEGLAWGPQGAFLYGADGTRLYRFTPGPAPRVDLLCSNLAAPGGEIEALAFAPSGTLVGSRHLEADRSLIGITFPLDPPRRPGTAVCTTVDIEIPGTDLVNDIESIDFECSSPDDEGDDEGDDESDDKAHDENDDDE